MGATPEELDAFFYRVGKAPPPTEQPFAFLDCALGGNREIILGGTGKDRFFRIRVARYGENITVEEETRQPRKPFWNVHSMYCVTPDNLIQGTFVTHNWFSIIDGTPDSDPHPEQHGAQRVAQAVIRTVIANAQYNPRGFTFR